MEKDHIAKVTIHTQASVSSVWDALVKPEIIKQYMFGTTVKSDWRKGSMITWKGEWKGKPYEDKGSILEIEPMHMLKYTHFSPLSGKEDIPANYNTVTVELSREANGTGISLSQNNNETSEAKQHSEENWQMALEGLKKYVEK